MSSSIMKKINIIAPAYNESEGIKDFNNALFQVIRKMETNYVFEITYILDKSTDNTAEVIKEICDQHDNVRLITLSRRFGHQMSLVAGMDRSSGDAVIMMDSDLEHPPEVIAELLVKFEQGYDIVHTIKNYNTQVSFLKRFTSKLFYKILHKLSVNIVADASDYRLISKKVLHLFQNNIREHNQFLRGLFPWVGFNQAFVPFTSGKRKKGVSKYNVTKLIAFAFTGIISFSKAPLKFSIIVGFMSSLCGVIYAIYGTFQYFTNATIPPGWTSLIVLVSMLGGIQLIAIGIIGEYIGSIFDETKNRPLYIIEEEYSGSSAKKQKIQ